MKTLLSLVLIALIVSVAGTSTAFADIKLDSLVNIAMQARSQVKIQLDNSPGASDEIKSLYEQGNSETDLLISAARSGNVNEAKQHFLAAMKIFKQVSVSLSEPQLATLQKAQVDPAVLTNYKNDINRTEKYVGMLKDLAAKNGFTIDFSKVDGLIQNARSSIAENDIQSVERIVGELKTALAELQNAIREQTIRQQNERAKAFANSYVAKIDTMLAQANQLGLSENDIAKLVKAKEDIASTNDPNQIIIKVKRYSINFSIVEPQNQIQRILAETSKLDAKLSELESNVDENIQPKFTAAKELVAQIKSQTSVDEATKLLRLLDSTVKEIENYIQSQSDQLATQTETASKPITKEEQKSSPSQEREQKETKKNQKSPSEISRFEARLAYVESHLDEDIKPKFDRAVPLFSKLKNQETASNADYLRTVRMLDLLLDQMERHIQSTQDSGDDAKTDQSKDKQSQDKSEKKRSSK